jgi:hypothetical protein
VVELAKPPHQWCDLCVKGKGCTIYDNRPQSCIDFACVWLQAPPSELDDRLRPDRVGVVLQPAKSGRGLVAHCDPQTPTAWRRPLILDVLKRVARGGDHASAIAGNRYWIITEKTEQEVGSKPNEISTWGMGAETANPSVRHHE